MIARSASLAALFVAVGLSAAAASEPRLVDAPLPPARPANLALAVVPVTDAPIQVVAPLPPRRPAALGEPVRTLASIDAPR